MKMTNNWFRIIFLGAILLTAFSPLKAQEKYVFNLTSDALQSEAPIELDKVQWKYQAGDDTNWAAPQLDDSEWETVVPADMKSDKLPKDWCGIGWFRLHLNADGASSRQILSLALRHHGASEIYVDGKLIGGFGQVAANAAKEVTYNPVYTPVGFTFDGAGQHTIAIRYSNTEIENYPSLELPVAFFVQTQRLDHAIAYSLSRTTLIQRLLISNIAISGLLGLLHMVLFVLYPRQSANLFYSLFLFGWMINTLGALTTYHGGLEQLPVSLIGESLSSIMVAIGFIVYIHRAVNEPLPRKTVGLLAGWILYILFLEFTPVMVPSISHWIASYPGHVNFQLALRALIFGWSILSILFVIARSLRRGIKGSIFVGAVGTVFVLLLLLILAQNFQLIPQKPYLIFLGIGIVFLFLINTVFLAFEAAGTSRILENKLVEVETLSQRAIEHEKDKARLLLVEAENERRAKELEEARQLQLSMLPKKLPELPNLEIAAYMKPATEVGGDYYDFHVGNDGTLTVAVGDATGHGLRAGSMVTATKSLFNAFADEPDIPSIFRQSNHALKKMNLRGLYMALAMLKIKNNRASLSCAGMPPILIYRNNIKQVEEISIKAMPLGSIANFPYCKQEFDLSEGDCILMMSDGFPEMFNAQNEMIGFEKAAEILPEIVSGSSQEIINRFVEIGETWAGQRPSADDVTFVVIKVKADENGNKI
jgi:serine phosphatase RsbU (regulator of sigma subunit)